MTQGAKTFAELGIPFPLFLGPVSEASEYSGEFDCSLCGAPGHVFRLAIGADVIVECSGCGEPTAVDADDRSSECYLCQATNEIEDSDDDLLCCYRCLREGRAALTKDTEHGMIRWEDAMRGESHGLPRESERTFTVGEQDQTALASDSKADELGNTDWVSVPLSREDMLELLRTPTYTTWQGERWLFDNHHRPLPYRGTWGQKQFRATRSDQDGLAAFLQAVAPDSDAQDIWKGVGEDGNGGVTVYVFANTDLTARAHYDYS